DLVPGAPIGPAPVSREFERLKRRKRSAALLSQGWPASGQKVAAIGIEQAGFGVCPAAVVGEQPEPLGKGSRRLLAGEERRRVEQRLAAAGAAKLIVSAQKLLPLCAAGGGWVDGERRPLPGIGEQRLAVLHDGVADARQIAAVSG